MSLTIGRVGVDVNLDNPQVWNQQGDKISLSGYAFAPTVEDAKALRQQLTGYVNNLDEPIVPVTWTEDATATGFYEVLDATVNSIPTSLAVGWFAFSLNLQRVRPHLNPQLESALVGAVRTNALSITTGTMWHAIPGDGLDWWRPVPSLSSSIDTRAAADGTVRIFWFSGYSTANSWPASFFVPAESYYKQSAKIEVATSAAPSTFRASVGRQLPKLAHWRISNGLVSLGDSGTVGSLDLSSFNGTSWGAPLAIKLHDNTGPLAMSVQDNPTVLRNAPEAVTIRITALPIQGMQSGRINLDLTLRRGARLVEAQLTADSLSTYGVRATSAMASTSFTGGLRKTTNDTDGNQPIFVSPAATTKDTTNGILYSTGNTGSFSFAVGHIIAASSPAAFDNQSNLLAQYMFTTSERQRVVGR